MTEPKRPKTTGSVIVSDFKTGSDAILNVILAQMREPVFPNISDPTVNGLLRLTAQHLIDNPDLLGPPSSWRRAAVEIFRQFVADHPRRGLDNAAIADAVDQVLLLDRAKKKGAAHRGDLTLALDKVATALDVEIDTVKKAHLRHRNKKSGCE